MTMISPHQIGPTIWRTGMLTWNDLAGCCMSNPGEEPSDSNLQRVPSLQTNSNAGGMVLKRDNNINFNMTRGKKKKSANIGEWRPWSELPEDMLNLILKQLNLRDYFAIGGVCRRWSSFVEAYKQDYMASQPPLVVIISTHAKRSCFFYNIFDGRTHKALLPYFAGRSCFGFSCGYLIMQDKNCSNELWVVNPLTRDEHRFCYPPHCAARVIIASSIMPYPNLVIVAISRSHSNIQFCRSIDANWTVLSFAGEPWVVVDVAVFKGKIYVLTNLGGLGILNLSSHPILTLLKVENTPNLSPDMQLVASDDELLMVDFHAFKQPKVYKLNFLRMEWLKVGNLGDQALFLGDLKCSAIRNPTRWGGRSNCLYHIEFATSTCYSYSLDGEILEIFPIVDKDQARSLWYVSPLWYFPHQCNTVDFLYED